jgi:hypothetical protein
MRLIFLLVLLGGCLQGNGGQPPSLSQEVKAVLGDVELQLEVASTPEEREIGLMHRRALGERQGMLFVFEEAATHPIWMKNMEFPLDILWLDGDMRVVHVLRDVPPCRTDPCPIYAPPVEAAYVLELPANFTLRHGIGTGAQLVLETAYRAP